MIDDTRLEINLPANGLRNGRKVVVYGEVWGKNENGEESPVAWIGGMAIAEGRTRTTIPVTLDGRWLARSNAKDDFELRNVRIQDPDYFVTLARADKIALTIPVLPDAAKSGFAEINDEMRMGVRPGKYDTENAVGGKLMLVHGYCSGGNPFPTSQFSSNIVFSDLNQKSHARSICQFNQKLRRKLPVVRHRRAQSGRRGFASSLHILLERSGFGRRGASDSIGRNAVSRNGSGGKSRALSAVFSARAAARITI